MSVAMTLAFRMDVNAPLVTHMPVTLMMQGDDRANVIELTMVDGDTPLNLDGYSAVLYLGRKDGVKVRCPGTVAGNVAKVTLQAECYSVPGPYAAVMKLTGPEEKRTVLRLAGHVESDGEGPIIDPSGTIPSYEDLARIMKELEEALQQAENATSGANAAAQNANTAAGSANAAAGAANTAASNANAAASALNGLTASATTLAPDQPATGEAKLVDGAWKIELGVPQGIQGVQGVRGITAYQGSAITGTSTTPTAYATGIASALAGDLYLYTGSDNANIGNMYTCTQGGDASTALWAYATNWRGAPGTGNVSTVNGVQPDQDGNVDLPGQIYSCAAAALEDMTQEQQAELYVQGYMAIKTENNGTVVLLGLAADGSLEWLGCNQPRQNLLHNPNFPIAQAGYGGTHGTQVYAADRWKGSGTGATFAAGSGGGLTITCGTGAAGCSQVVADPPEVGDYFSFVVVSGGTTLIASGTWTGTAQDATATSGTLTATVNAGSVQISVASGSATVDYCMMLVGSYTPKTLPPWEKPDPVIEYLKCLKYAWVIINTSGSDNFVFSGMSNLNGTAVYLPIIFPVPMREGGLPTMEVIGNNQIYNQYVPYTSYELFNYTKNDPGSSVATLRFGFDDTPYPLNNAPIQFNLKNGGKIGFYRDL